MSIFLSAASSAPAQAVSTTQPNSTSSNLLITILCWTALSIILMRVCGVFRRRSVEGPFRLDEQVSGFDLLLVMCVAFGAQQIATSVIFGAVHVEQNRRAITADMGGALVGIAVMLVAIPGFCRIGLARFGLDARRALVGFALGILAWAIIFPLVSTTSIVVEAVMGLFRLRQPHPHAVLEMLGTHPGIGETIALCVRAVLVAPLAEEMFFRGLLQTALGRLFSWIACLPALSRNPLPPSQLRIPAPGSGTRWTAIIVTSLLFALVHGEPAFFMPLFVLAVGLGYVYERTGNLWINFTAHALFNAIEILLYLSARTSS